MDGEDKRLHLQMIEDVITRMGSNSFLIKGWSMTALGGLITVYITHMNEKWSNYLLVFGMVMCLLFWMNDAYFLSLEREYRELYDKVARTSNCDIDFSMKITRDECDFVRAMFSTSFKLSYLMIEIIFAIFLLLAIK